MPLPIGGGLRPNTAKVERRQTGGAVSNTGTPIDESTALLVIAALPCLIDSTPRGTQLVDGKLGPIIEQVYTLYADGIGAGGAAPGTVITLAGVPYVVSSNGQNAFPDLRQDDRITREDGMTFLVLALPELYYSIFPGVQAHLQPGKAWS